MDGGPRTRRRPAAGTGRRHDSRGSEITAHGSATDLADLPRLRGGRRAAAFRQLVTLIEADARAITADEPPAGAADLAAFYCATLCRAVTRALDHLDQGAAA